MFFAQKWEQKKAIYQRQKAKGINCLLSCISYRIRSCFFFFWNLSGTNVWSSSICVSLSQACKLFKCLFLSLSSCMMTTTCTRHEMKHSWTLYENVVYNIMPINHWLSPSLWNVINSFLSSFASNLLHNSRSAILLRFILLLLFVWQFPIMLVFHFNEMEFFGRERRIISKGNIKNNEETNIHHFHFQLTISTCHGERKVAKEI